MTTTVKTPYKNPFATDPLERDRQSSGGILESLLGQSESQDREYPRGEQKSQAPVNREVFSFSTRRENALIPQEIEQLKEAIKQEVKQLKAVNQSVSAQISSIEKEAIHSNPERVGIYHVRFLETLLSMLRLLRVKVSEAGTWLDALNSKKAKRGSLFSQQTKSGSKDSITHLLSGEKSSARSVQ